MADLKDGRPEGWADLTTTGVSAIAVSANGERTTKEINPNFA
jgi:hypothetical protein